MLEAGYHKNTKKLASKSLNKPHVESAINIPIVKQILSDPYFKISKRPIDSQWLYEKKIPLTSCGFNPATNRAYIGTNSFLSQWLKNPNQSIRPFNFKDGLINELFYVVHDYFHCWSYSLINELQPNLKFGYGPITKKNFEDYVFCHILTEAVATVGLDYWFLSTVDLNDIIPIGTNQSTLTVSYHLKNQKEYQRFNSNFNLQTPDFFKSIMHFYCDGIFDLMPIHVIKQSPMIHKWCWHEMSYGSTQRKYTRMWLSYLAKEKIGLSPQNLGDKINYSKSWMKKLIDDVAIILWKKVKQDQPLYFKPKYDTENEAWGIKSNGVTDYRFMNIAHGKNEFNDPMVGGILTQENFRYFLFQYVMRHQYSPSSSELAKVLPEVAKQQDFSLLKTLLKNHKKLNKSDFEPAALFLLP